MAKVTDQLEFNFSTPSEQLPELWTVDDIYSAASQAVLDKLSEDRRIDYKSARISPRTMAESIVMFANNQPDGGVIVLGREADGTVSGCSSLSTSQLNDIEQADRVFCPDARCDFKRIPAVNVKGENDFLELIRVQYRTDRLVETTSGDAFIRSGDSKKRLTEEEKREIRINKGEIDFELEACNLKYPDEFDTELITHFCSSYKQHRNLEQDHTTEDILILNHLGKTKNGQFEPNLACALLFSTDPTKIIPGARVRFLRFEGIEEGTGSSFNVVKDLHLEGSVPQQIIRTAEAIKFQIRDFTRLGDDGKFYTFPEYPDAAWYEVVVNACVHRSYNLKNMDIFVKMFDDRIVVESPGGFPPLVTPENIYDMHNPRNPHLMRAMYYLDFVKCAHEGTRRIRDTMMASNLPAPEFSQKEIGNTQVHVTLRNDVEHRKTFVDANAARIVGESVFDSLDENERIIINYLAERVRINVTDAQRITGKGWQYAKGLLDGLVDKKILEYRRPTPDVERDPKAHYVLRRPNGDP